jgi:magnesium transporter
VSVDDTAGEALGHLQGSSLEGRIIYFYVVDGEGRLKGVLPTRRLLLNPPDTPVRSIMEPHVVTLPDTSTLLDACEFFILHRLLALPVVDAGGRLLGVVDVELYTDEISDLARRHESDEVFQLIGVRLAQMRQAGTLGAYRMRFPWLLCNIGGGLACALLAGLFENVLDQVIVLALFIPIVLAMAESVSIQSLTLALQVQDGEKPSWRQALAAIRREAVIGLLLGVSCGGLVALVAWIWHGQALVAFCLAGSILLSIATAALIGMCLPTALRALQRDPKVASGPLALAMTDVLTLFYYLGLAALLLS